MKKMSLGLLAAVLALGAFAQQSAKKSKENTLLWRISGNGLTKPSYLFGTIHMLCEDDAVLSDSVRRAIRNSEHVYFEVDMDNIFEMIGTLKEMKMKNDLTWKDLLTDEEYLKVKSYFENRSTMLPFATLETYKPFLAASLLMESGMNCENSVAMEQVIMLEAKKNQKTIHGLETMASQMAIFDSIPYQIQAKQLLDYVEKAELGKGDNKEFEDLVRAYLDQDLKRLEEISIKSDPGIANFTEILLFARNRRWVEKLSAILADRPLLIAVGAGHLPGEQGVINLLRKAGYKLTPVANKISLTKQI